MNGHELKGYKNNPQTFGDETYDHHGPMKSTEVAWAAKQTQWPRHCVFRLLALKRLAEKRWMPWPFRLVHQWSASMCLWCLCMHRSVWSSQNASPDFAAHPMIFIHENNANTESSVLERPVSQALDQAWFGQPPRRIPWSTSHRTIEFGVPYGGDEHEVLKRSTNFRS